MRQDNCSRADELSFCVALQDDFLWSRTESPFSHSRAKYTHGILEVISNITLLEGNMLSYAKNAKNDNDEEEDEDHDYEEEEKKKVLEHH